MEKIIGAVLDKLSQAYPETPFAVRFWDGKESRYGKGTAKFTVTIRSEGTIKKILGGGTQAFGEEYMDGNIDIEGDLQTMVAFSEKWEEIAGKMPLWARIGARLKQLLPRTIGVDKKNIHYHYDIGDDFYSLWLDPTMTYSCAYFKEAGNDLETAQKNKYDHICRKLRLQEGQTLVDIGCGWGGMMFYAAENYGAKCTGYTLAENQFDSVKQKIEEKSLGGKVEIYLADYRKAKGKYDKFVSIGMFEHVGKKNYPEFFKSVKKILNPKGIGVLQTIGGTTGGPNDPWIEKYIFPGGFIPTLGMISDNMAKAKLVLQDVENLGLHYGMTLDAWVGNFENRIDAVRRAVVNRLRDEKQAERFIRMWRLYLNASSTTFKNGGNRLYQVIFSNGIDNNWPLTRNYIYHSKCYN